MTSEHDARYRAFATRDSRYDGRLFIGVRTTGIYCRPICPARTPRPENVTFFPTAAAAQEAGFRPCLRCRPEASPELAAWHGTSSTVSRGLALIADGGLDGQAVGTLAERLGLGERQVRRLFRQHLGASPVAVAQTRRVLFARQLIAETDMRLGDIAIAAGFGSIRRFNTTFRALYGQSPSTLRRTPKPGPDPAGITLLLPYAPPYDWEALIGYLRGRAIPGVETVDASEAYHRVVVLDGAMGSISVAHAPAESGLRVTIRFPRVNDLTSIVARVRRQFDLATDPNPVRRHLESDPVLAPLVAKRPGLRVPGAWDGFELAIRAILGQQISVSAATQLSVRLVAHYGTPVNAAMPDGLTHAFPEPARLVTADPAVLRLPAARAKTIAALARATESDPGLFDPSQDPDAAIAALRALPGIGDWTAQYVAMRVLRAADGFPAGDVALLRAMADENGRRPTPRDLLSRAEAWRPWRAYAALHLWASDIDRPAAKTHGRASAPAPSRTETIHGHDLTS